MTRVQRRKDFFSAFAPSKVGQATDIAIGLRIHHRVYEMEYLDGASQAGLAI
jgi:hypothetical protein